MTGENSVSVSSTLASPCSRMKAIVSASRRMFSAFSTAPAIGTPKCASKASGTFGAITATVSPRPMPCACQRRGEPAAAFQALPPGVAALAVDDRDAVRIDRSRAPQKPDRRQRHVIGRVLVEAGFVGVARRSSRACRRSGKRHALREMLDAVVQLRAMDAGGRATDHESGAGKLGSANEPTVMPYHSGARSPSQNTLLPQCGQKWKRISKPLSAMRA